jgi:hypothetical protein
MVSTAPAFAVAPINDDQHPNDASWTGTTEGRAVTEPRVANQDTSGRNGAAMPSSPADGSSAQMDNGARIGTRPSGIADDNGNVVHSRQFDGTRQLEQSGRGSSLGMAPSPDETSQSGAASADDTATAPSDMTSAPAAGTAANEVSAMDETVSPSIPDQAASNQAAGPDGSALSAESTGVAFGDESSAGPAGGPSDKLVVIVPPNWEGSVPDLIASLETGTEESAIVVVSPNTWHGDAPSHATGGTVQTPDE